VGDFSFLSNAYGGFGLTLPDEAITYRKVSDNSVYLNSTYTRDTFACSRTGHSSNPRHLLSGVGPMWRNPSSYSRWGYRFEGVIAGKYKVGTGGFNYADNAFLARTNLNNTFIVKDTNPHFYPGTTHLVKFTNGEVENSRIRAESKAISDLASSKASLGENLAQLNQTVDLFGTVVESAMDVFRAFHALKQGKIPKLSSLSARGLKKLVRDRKLEKRIANYWLSYWYGFKPLVSDAYGLWLLMQEQSGKGMLVHGRGRSRVEHTGEFVTLPDASFSTGLRFSDGSSVCHQTHLTGSLNDAYMSRIINRAGLLNLPDLAWELLPFSFVVDWGVPVGEFLSNLTATSGLTFVGGSSTVRFERELTVSVSPGWQIGTSCATSHLWGFGMQRAVLTKFPSGGLYLKPFFTGASRFATIAALLSNLTR